MIPWEYLVCCCYLHDCFAIWLPQPFSLLMLAKAKLKWELPLMRQFLQTLRSCMNSFCLYYLQKRFSTLSTWRAWLTHTEPLLDTNTDCQKRSLWFPGDGKSPWRSQRLIERNGPLWQAECGHHCSLCFWWLGICGLLWTGSLLFVPLTLQEILQENKHMQQETFGQITLIIPLSPQKQS